MAYTPVTYRGTMANSVANAMLNRTATRRADSAAINQSLNNFSGVLGNIDKQQTDKNTSEMVSQMMAAGDPESMKAVQANWDGGRYDTKAVNETRLKLSADSRADSAEVRAKNAERQQGLNDAYVAAMLNADTPKKQAIVRENYGKGVSAVTAASVREKRELSEARKASADIAQKRLKLAQQKAAYEQTGGMGGMDVAGGVDSFLGGNQNQAPEDVQADEGTNALKAAADKVTTPDATAPDNVAAGEQLVKNSVVQQVPDPANAQPLAQAGKKMTAEQFNGNDEFNKALAVDETAVPTDIAAGATGDMTTTTDGNANAGYDDQLDAFFDNQGGGNVAPATDNVAEVATTAIDDMEKISTDHDNLTSGLNAYYNKKIKGKENRRGFGNASQAFTDTTKNRTVNMFKPVVDVAKQLVEEARTNTGEGKVTDAEEKTTKAALDYIGGIEKKVRDSINSMPGIQNKKQTISDILDTLGVTGKNGLQDSISSLRTERVADVKAEKKRDTALKDAAAKYRMTSGTNGMIGYKTMAHVKEKFNRVSESDIESTFDAIRDITPKSVPDEIIYDAMYRTSQSKMRWYPTLDYIQKKDSKGVTYNDEDAAALIKKDVDQIVRDLNERFGGYFIENYEG